MPEELHVMPHRSQRSPTLRDLVAVFFRHKQLLKISFVAAATVGILYFAFFPSYKAEMKVLVRRGRIDPAITPTPSPSPAFEHDEVTEEELNSEVEVLRDDDILRQVAMETGLARITWFSKLSGQTPEERIEKSARRLASGLEITPVRKSRLITIVYSSPDPQKAAAVLSSLELAYMVKHAKIRRPSGQQTFFERQVNESHHALEQAQANLIAFTRREGVVSAELERDLILQKLSDAESSELGVQTAIAEIRGRGHSLEEKLRDLPERRVGQIKNADNPQLQEKLKSKLLELELRRTELLTKFQPSYRLVQEVDEQIAQAKAAIEAEDLKPLRDETTEQDPEHEWAHEEHLKTQVELSSMEQRQAVALAQISEYRAAAQRLGERSVVQHDLEQRLKATEEKYLLYANKREEARIGDALDEDGVLNVAVAQEPHEPAIPVWPLWAGTCLSLLGACGFSTGLVFAADYFDPSLRTPEEVIGFLGMPVLASLPSKSGPQSLEAS